VRLLLFSDPHIVDAPTEEYRWEFLEKSLPSLAKQYGVDKIWCLGDLTDRRDRHSGTLVNRLVKVVRTLPVPLKILMGNHDGALGYKEGHYWEFLTEIDGVEYFTEPTFVFEMNLLALPFSPTPLESWKNYSLNQYKCVLMHQTVAGALIEGNRKISEQDGHKLPVLPRGVPIYSGDVHRPQQVGPITYVGTPYPVRFGEDWPGRVLIVDSSNYSKYEEIILSSIRRTILDLNPANLEKLKTGGWKSGDQLRVRFSLNSQNLANWPEDEARIRDLVAATGATLLSVEALLSEEITTESKTLASSTNLEELDPKDTLRLFAKEESISQELLDTGISILENVNLT